MSYDGIPLEIFKGFSNNRNNEKNLNNNQSTLDHINYYNKSIVAKIYKSIGINDVSDSVLAYSSDIFSSCNYKFIIVFSL